MGQILALDALLMVDVYIPAVCCSASSLPQPLKRDDSVALLNSYWPPTYIVRVLSRQITFILALRKLSRGGRTSCLVHHGPSIQYIPATTETPTSASSNTTSAPKILMAGAYRRSTTAYSKTATVSRSTASAETAGRQHQRHLTT